nr:hypothetical protein [Okeania sp. SIO2F4]
MVICTKLRGRAITLDAGIKYFLADSNGNTVENIHFYRKSQKHL